MNDFTIINSPAGLKVAEFPDAAKLLEVSSEQAEVLASLNLHAKDLEFALECISAMNEVPSDAHLLHEALWRAALVHFYKCFHSGVRKGLQAEDIFSGNPDREAALEVFEYYKHVRDKHVVHDVNHMTQCVVSAVLNDGRQAHKIDQIVCITGSVELVNNESFGSLQKLISDTLAWVKHEFAGECKNIASELEKLSYDELLNHPAAAMPAEVDITRASIKASRPRNLPPNR